MDLKPFLTVEEQLALLKSRGLIIEDDDAALSCLHQLNYYRLSGYTLTLRRGNKFYKDITFSDVMQIYNFDRELKMLLLQWLEDVEISLRTHIGYVLGSIGPTSYLDSSSFVSDAHHDIFRKELSNALKDNKNEAFVKHHNTKYGGVLPSWAIIETLSFGAISRLFSNLDVNIKKEICSSYYINLRYTYIENWLESLVVTRNLCAHHARLFNRGLPNAIKFGKDDFDYFLNIGFDTNAIGKKLFFPIVVLDRISHDHADLFINGINNLIKKYPFVSIKHYGFPDDWENVLSTLNEKYHV